MDNQKATGDSVMDNPRIPCWTIIQTKDGWVLIDAEDVSEPLPDLADALDRLMDDLEEE